MIRKQHPPTVWWAFAALGAGAIGMIAMWAWRFAGTYWGLSTGQVMYLNWGNGSLCLWPWDAMTCRELFRINGYANMQKITAYQTTVFAPLLVGLGVFGFGVWQRWFRQKDRIILAGPTVSDYPALVKKARREQKTGSLPLFAEWGLSDMRSLNGMIVFGAPGSGKTNLLRYMLQSTADVGDRKVVYGYKPNVFELMPKDHPTPGNESGEPINLNPADRRSWIWDIAKDCMSKAECINLARSIIQGEEHKFFQQSAQAVAAVVLIKLHSESPGEWTWTDFMDGFRLEKDDFAELARIYHPDALSFIAVEDRQWDGTRATLQASLDNLQLLAIAWKDYNSKRLISIRAFMQDPDLPRTLVLGHSGRFDELSKLWISVFMTVAAKSVFHENFKAEAGKRTWFILDEFARLAKIDGIDELVTAGRERGVSVVLGLQDFHAIEGIYGPHAFKTWMSSIQTKIICRTEPGETASWLMRILGKTRIRELKLRPGPNGGMVREWNEYEDNALRESEMSTELGVEEGKGTWVIVAGYGRDLFRILVPFMARTTLREGYLPAAWVEDVKPTQPPEMRDLDPPIAAE